MSHAAEIVVESPTQRRIALAGSFDRHGEPARIERDAAGHATALWLGGTRMQDEASTSRELSARYEAGEAEPSERPAASAEGGVDSRMKSRS